MGSSHSIRLIVGLGNPGAEYAATRHNVGFWLIDALIKQFNSSPLSLENKFFGATGQLSIAHKNIRLLTPNTYMNRSGQAVAAIANFYKIHPEEILVVHDELDLAPGIVRLKSGGGHGGHNGLRDIIQSLGNQKNFARLRIGIGHPGNSKQVSNFVLKAPSSTEAQWINESIDEAIRHIDNIITGDWEKAMNGLHTFNANPA